MADARREGVQLLMERSFGDPAWEGDADEEEAPSRGPEEEGEEDAEERELVARAVALSRRQGGAPAASLDTIEQQLRDTQKPDPMPVASRNQLPASQL